MPGIFDTGIFDLGIFDHDVGADPKTLVDFGVSSVQRIGDTRWQGVREAREAARNAFRDVEKAKPAKRKAAARKAAEAVAEVAKAVAKPPLPKTGGSRLDMPDADPVLAELQALQGILAAMADAERIRAEQAREAAAQWARIEAEMVENALQDELMLVLALAA